MTTETTGGVLQLGDFVRRQEFARSPRRIRLLARGHRPLALRTFPKTDFGDVRSGCGFAGHFARTLVATLPRRNVGSARLDGRRIRCYVLVAFISKSNPY